MNWFSVFVYSLPQKRAKSPDGEHVVAPHPGLDDGDPLVMDDGVAVNGKDGRVPVPDPGDRVILDLAKINKYTYHYVVTTWCTLQGRWAMSPSLTLTLPAV